MTIKYEAKQTAYRNGDKIEFTGHTQTHAGGLFHEFIWLDGIRAGKIGYTQKTPTEVDGLTQADVDRAAMMHLND
jgi:hypothetical protein